MKILDSNGHEIVLTRGREINFRQPGFFGHAYHLDGTIACDGEFQTIIGEDRK